MLTTLLLFDIDGTLIKEAGAVEMALGQAVEDCLGISVDLDTLEGSGRTDAWLIQEIIGRSRRTADPMTRDALRRRFLHNLVHTIRLKPGELCPGVRPLLDILVRKSATTLALATGNLERSARLKLAAHDLNAYFPTGGFGEDGVERDAIIAAAIARAQADRVLRFDRVVVIGDTTFDAAGARANRVHSLCVATGVYDAATLWRAGATVVLPDLTPTATIVEAIDALLPTEH